MFERFAERGRQVVVLAQDESRALGQPWIGTDHLLLGLIREGGEASRALDDAGLTLERARQAVTTLVGTRGERVVSGQIPFTREAKKALEGSLKESVRLQAGEITPSLILLGVLAVGSGTAACVLRDCGVDVEVVIRALEVADRTDPSLYRQHADAKPEKTFAGLSAESSSPRLYTAEASFYAGFTERARQVMVLAQDEARALKHDYVGTEHLLLGLLRAEEALAARVLASLNIRADPVRARIALIVGEGDEVATGDLPFAPNTKRVRELAMLEAHSLGHNYIGTEHLLLGLVRENESVAVRTLLDFGADPEKIRNVIVRMLSGPGRRGAGPASTMSAVREGPLDAAARSMTVGELIDAVTAVKEAALNDNDHPRAEVARGIERQFTMIVKRLSDITGHSQSPSVDGEGEAPSA